METPGGWQDFLSQNPGFFGAPPRIEPAKAAQKPAAAPKASAKLSYKDQRRLSELETLIADMPGKMSALETALADPNLYSRDPAGFDRFSRALEAARTQLATAEEEWLALEERREELESGR